MFQVQESLCTGCRVCIEVCPADAIHVEQDRARIDPTRCDECGVCAEVCPEEAIHVVPEPVWVAPAVHVDEGTRTPPETEASREIIQIQLPPPPVVQEVAPSPAQIILPTVGAALAFLGREIGPKLVNLAIDLIEERLARSRTAQPVQRSESSRKIEPAATGDRSNTASGRGRGRGRRRRGRRRDRF